MLTGLSKRFLAVLASAVALVTLGLCFGDSPSLEASPTAIADADGDLLTDDIEWVLLTDSNNPDSDGDGIGDFLAAVTYRYMNPFTDGEAVDAGMEPNAGSGGVADDHAVRVVLSMREDPDGTNAIWMHYLFRFVNGVIPDIHLIQPWIHANTVTSPLTVFGSGPTELAIRDAGAEGLFVLLSSRIGREVDMLQVAPATIGSSIVMDGRMINSGVLLTDAAGRAAVLTPVSRYSTVAVSLDTLDDPFWSVDRVCQIRLGLISSSPSGNLVEIVSAVCRSARSTRCPPSCTTSQGAIIHIPDGYTTLTGD